LIRSRVREKESGIDESPVQSRRRRPEFLLGVALVVLGALGGVILQRRGDDGVLVVALARDADLRALRIERSAAAAFVPASEAGALLGRIMHVDVPAGTPLTAAMTTTDTPLSPDEAIVPMALDAGTYPPDVRVGDVLRIITAAPPGLGEERAPTVIEPVVVVHDVREPEQFSDRIVIAVRGPLVVAQAVSGTVDVRLVRVSPQSADGLLASGDGAMPTEEQP
jgi:hypothetical protein